MIAQGSPKHTLNAGLFITAWLACAFWANAGSATFAVVLVVVHLLLISPKSQIEARGIIMCAAVGIVVDTLWQNLGILRFPQNSGAYAEGLIPVWLVGIWLGFAITLGHSLQRMLNGDWSSLLFPALAGPASYGLLSATGPLEVGYGWLGYATLSMGFVLVFQVQKRIMHWLDQID